MAAVVLYDGAPASGRALELACVPGFLVQHNSEQLVVVHAWKDSRDPTQLTVPATVVDAIAKSRVAQATLNYKLDMLKLPSDIVAGQHGASTPLGGVPMPVTPPLADGKAAAGNGAAAPTAASSASPSTAGPASPTKGGKGAGKADAVPPPVVELPAGGSQNDVIVPAKVAAYVSDYAASRMSHYGTKALVLGVGNQLQGKNIVLGSVAKAMVHQQRSRVPFLFAVKATGPTVRPTAPLRMLVLIVPGRPLTHLRKALAIAKVQQRQDRLGVVIVGNNGCLKPAADVLQLQPADSPSGGSPQAGGGRGGAGGPNQYEKDAVDTSPAALLSSTTAQCLDILAAAGLRDADGTGTDDGATSVAQESFPLINVLFLEPTHALPTPTVDEVPLQLVKFVGSIKVDFLVLPPAAAGSTTGDTVLVNACLAAPKPHILLM